MLLLKFHWPLPVIHRPVAGEDRSRGETSSPRRNTKEFGSTATAGLAAGRHRPAVPVTPELADAAIADVGGQR